MNIIQLSLFPSFKEFDPKRFEDSIDASFVEIISSVLEDACIKVASMGIEQKRVLSDVMNDVAFTMLRDKLLASGYISENDYHFNKAGNSKNCFMYKGYVFILSKSGAGKNSTHIAEAIAKQNCENYIVQIQYTIDRFWTELVSKRFVYSVGDTILYSHDIINSEDRTIYNNTDENVMPAVVSVKGELAKKAVNNE